RGDDRAPDEGRLDVADLSAAEGAEDLPRLLLARVVGDRDVLADVLALLGREVERVVTLDGALRAAAHHGVGAQRHRVRLHLGDPGAAPRLPLPHRLERPRPAIAHDAYVTRLHDRDGAVDDCYK